MNRLFSIFSLWLRRVELQLIAETRQLDFNIHGYGGVPTTSTTGNIAPYDAFETLKENIKARTKH